MIKPKTIDFTSTTFVSNGNTYHFYLDAISNVRLERFLSLCPRVKFGMNNADVHQLLLQLYDKLKGIKVDSFFEDIYLCRDLVFSKLKMFEGVPSEKVTQSTIDLIYEFSCLYVLADDEDATKIDERLWKRKIEDWKTDIDFNSFFFLHKLVSATFPPKLDLTLAAAMWKEVNATTSLIK